MRHARDLLNCWIVAMWFWGHAWAEFPVAVRRSHVWWCVPHFIATLPGRWRHFFAVEFVPPRHQRWTRSDFVLMFRGRYRVTEYRATSVQWFDSRAEVMAWTAWRRRTPSSGAER